MKVFVLRKYLTPLDKFIIDLRQIQGRTLAAFDDLCIVTIDLDRFDPAFNSSGKQYQFISHLCRSADGNTAGNGPKSFDGKTSLNRQAKNTFGAFRLDLSRDLLQRSIKVVESLAGNAGHWTNGRIF